MKSTKNPTKPTKKSTKKGQWALQGSNLRPSDYEEGHARRKSGRRTRVHRSSVRASDMRKSTKARPKRSVVPTIRPTSQRRRQLIHDITTRSLRR
jgi:hypothetical protein